MLKFKSFKAFTLAFTLLTAPVLANFDEAENATCQQDADFRDKFSCGASFCLREFAGNYVFSRQSVGGVSGSTGYSVAFTGQIKIDKDGKGTFNLMSGSIYTGPVGTPTKRFVSLPKLEIQLIDNEHGTGTLTIYDPSIGYNETFNFVALKKNHIVTEIRGNSLYRSDIPVPPALPVNNVSVYTLIKQYQ